MIGFPLAFRSAASQDILLRSVRAPAATPATARPAIRSPSRTGRCATRSWIALARRGPHERKVHLDSLVQELSAVGAVDCGARLFQRGVLDQRVALFADADTITSATENKKGIRKEIGCVACLP
jgi:hypothetical protein